MSKADIKYEIKTVKWKYPNWTSYTKNLNIKGPKLGYMSRVNFEKLPDKFGQI